MGLFTRSDFLRYSTILRDFSSLLNAVLTGRRLNKPSRPLVAAGGLLELMWTSGRAAGAACRGESDRAHTKADRSIRLDPAPSAGGDLAIDSFDCAGGPYFFSPKNAVRQARYCGAAKL